MDQSNVGVEKEFTVFAICPADKEAYLALKKGLKALLEAKLSLTKASQDKEESQPFTSPKAKKAAFSYILHLIQGEILLAKLVEEVIAGKDHIDKEVPFSEANFVDMAGFMNYVNYVSKIHGEHLSSIVNNVDAIIQNHKDRGPTAQKLLQSRIRCANHPDRQAPFKDVSTNLFICAECAAPKKEKEEEKEEEETSPKIEEVTATD